MATMTKAERLRAIAREATSLAESLDNRAGSRDTLAIDVFQTLVEPGATLYASQAKEGRWWYYLVMPKDWTPPSEGPRWINDTSKGRFWDTGSADTKDEALRRGIQRLLEASQAKVKAKSARDESIDALIASGRYREAFMPDGERVAVDIAAMEAAIGGADG